MRVVLQPGMFDFDWRKIQQPFQHGEGLLLADRAKLSARLTKLATEPKHGLEELKGVLSSKKETVLIGGAIEKQHRPLLHQVRSFILQLSDFVKIEVVCSPGTGPNERYGDFAFARDVYFATMQLVRRAKHRLRGAGLMRISRLST